MQDRCCRGLTGDESGHYYFTMIRFLNKNKMAAATAFRLLWLAAKVCRVQSPVLSRAEELYAQREIEYSLGFIAWFLLYKLGRAVPAYNIYHLVRDQEKDWYLRHLKNGTGDYRVEKQYFLLLSDNEVSEEARERITAHLRLALLKPGGGITAKSTRLDTSRALESLHRIDGVLREAGLKPFLVSGTLLGAVREKGLIEGDNDLDIGIMSEEADDEKIYRVLIDQPFLQSVYNLGHLVQATDLNGTVIDIFIHYRENGKIWHGSAVHKWTNTSFQLAEMELGAHTFYVPEHPELYLDENYGNWRHRATFFDYVFDTPNHEFFPSLKALYFLTDRVLGEMAKSLPSRHTVETAMNELHALFDIDLARDSGTGSGVDTVEEERVVITFGTFDLFHIGHLNILQRAARLGNRLVVGVSSDALNLSKKGIYPVYSQEDRSHIVRAIECVSETFYEESLELKRDYILQFGAHVLVMGDDWKGKFDDLADICDVVYLPRTEDISTSETKDSIRKNL